MQSYASRRISWLVGCFHNFLFLIDLLCNSQYTKVLEEYGCCRIKGELAVTLTESINLYHHTLQRHNPGQHVFPLYFHRFSLVAWFFNWLRTYQINATFAAMWVNTIKPNKSISSISVETVIVPQILNPKTGCFPAIPRYMSATSECPLGFISPYQGVVKLPNLSTFQPSMTMPSRVRA